MNRPKLLVIVRHAESLRNVAKQGLTYFADEYARSLVKGIPDYKIDITPEGETQAELTGKGLFKEFGSFDYAYHSGYVRTERTLEKILSKFPAEIREKMAIRPNPFIRERHAGFTYDMTEEEAEKNFPYLKEYWKTFGGFFAQPPGGESLEQVAHRVYSFLGMIFKSRACQKVLVVTHGGPIRCFRFWLEHWTYDQALAWPPGQSPKNCGVTVYHYDDVKGKLKLRIYNKAYY